ncbi:limulus clotting factor C-like [Uloborus diversus]|uniref:limulus clotting factor C-like n=1 Tax=Uloborus diversus TaxID=327109 RepID=UPI0024094401|nr:limulus clotting factor C-like [Uloborus diversus]
MEMDGTYCTVFCDGRTQGGYFCYPGREWVPDLPYCVRAKDGSTTTSEEDTKKCECRNGGTCDPYGRCVCPSGRTGIHCEKGAPTIVGSQSTRCECINGGTCDPYGRCVCPAGRTGARCEEVACTDPGPLDNAIIQNDNRYPAAPRATYRPGETVWFYCLRGFTMQGVDSITCQTSGRWTKKPTCVPQTAAAANATTPAPVYCTHPGSATNGYSLNMLGAPTLSTAKYKPGETVWFYCNEGFAMQGPDSVTCQISGTWTKKPTCTRQTVTAAPTTEITQAPVICPNPGDVQNADRNVNGPAGPNPVYHPGHIVIYTCKPGYVRKGPVYVTCLSSGRWSSQKPICALITPEPNDPPEDNRVFCRDPGPIKNGKAMVYPPGGNARRFVVEHNFEYLEGTVLEYDCEDGYTPIGALSITCGSNGFWSAVIPSCIETCGKPQVMTQRITFGAETRAGQWPWTVAVAVIYDSVSVVECGGVLIDRRSVLTAAHCFDTSGSFELYFGKHRRQAEDDDNQVDKRTNLAVTIHPSYNGSTFDSDIALVRFWPEIRYTSRIQPICLPTPESTANNIRRGKDGIVTGWGLNEKDMPSDSLFMAYLPVLPGDYCMKAYRSQGKNFPITSNMYCAGRDEGGMSACSGDSGSPMVFYDEVMEHYTLEGIVSFGVNGQCSMPKSYTVMTKILPYLPWVIRTNYIY